MNRLSEYTSSSRVRGCPLRPLLGDPLASPHVQRHVGASRRPGLRAARLAVEPLAVLLSDEQPRAEAVRLGLGAERPGCASCRRPPAHDPGLACLGRRRPVLDARRCGRPVGRCAAHSAASTVLAAMKSSSAASGMRTWVPSLTNVMRRSAMSRRGNRSVVPRRSAAWATVSSRPAAVPSRCVAGGRVRWGRCQTCGRDRRDRRDRRDGGGCPGQRWCRRRDGRATVGVATVARPSRALVLVMAGLATVATVATVASAGLTVPGRPRGA